MKLKIWLTMILITFMASLARAGTTEDANASRSFSQKSEMEQYLFFKNLMNGKTMPAAVSNCRPDGYFCDHSYECCGFCESGVCKYGGGNSCRPDGAACSASYECCGFCNDGICGHGGGSSCRPDGLACNYSYECCGMCMDGRCKYGN